MIKCDICGKEFKNNLGGQLTVHLLNEHNIKYEDYYIKTVLNGVEPKCKCGFCNERPNFYRDKFSSFVIGHDKFDWVEEQYIKKYGFPKCENPECSNVVTKFHRGKPNRFCCFKCQPNNWNQDRVKQTVCNKYGVDNVFQLDNIKEKSKKTSIIKYGVEHPTKSNKIQESKRKTNIKIYGIDYPQKLDITKEKSRQTCLERYGVNNISKTKEFREFSSKLMCKTNANENNNYIIKTYKDTKLYYQSQYEYRFLELCENNDILNLIDNSPTFKYLDSNKWHVPDFMLGSDYIIEIKSSYWLKRQGGTPMINAKKESVESHGYKYILILDENYKEFLNLLVQLKYID